MLSLQVTGKTSQASFKKYPSKAVVVCDGDYAGGQTGF